MAKDERATVQINYKSGRTVIARAEKFKISLNGTRIEWDNMTPRPLMLGIDEIESIWEIT